MIVRKVYRKCKPDKVLIQYEPGYIKICESDYEYERPTFIKPFSKDKQ